MITAYPINFIGSGGGGHSNYELIQSVEVESKNTMTSTTTLTTIPITRNPNKILFVKIRDKRGKDSQSAYHVYGSDNFCVDLGGLQSSRQSYIPKVLYVWYQNGTKKFEYSASQYYTVNATNVDGVFLGKITSQGIVIQAKKSGTMDIEGTYIVDAYWLDWPTGISPFEEVGLFE